MLHSPYDFVFRMKELFSLMQDEKSQALFWDRLRCDVYPSIHYTADLYAHAFDLSEEEHKKQLQLEQQAEKLHQSGKKLLLYGAGGTGHKIAEMFRMKEIPFAGFCDCRAESLQEVQGKPVYSPDYLFSHMDECYVIVTAVMYFNEILDVLKSHKFPDDHILNYFTGSLLCPDGEQYFAFPQYFPEGTAFVDGGCFDGMTSLHFSKWCYGKYSKILAFEPDAGSAEICEQFVEKHQIRDFTLFRAGLSKSNGVGQFIACGAGNSYFDDCTKNENFLYNREETGHASTETKLLALDEVTADTRVGFIKMDIEGFELDALQGGEQTIKRDKPLLAICVYHRAGDVLAIMDYLHEIVPEYRFWLRHYTSTPLETVLYAAVPGTSEK